MSKKHPISRSVLLVDFSQGYGGVDVRVFDTAVALASAGREYSVAVITGSRIHQQLVDAKLRSCAFSCSKFDPRLIGKLSQEIAKNNFSVVDCHNFQSWLWSGFAVTGACDTKLVTSVHLPSRRFPGGPKGRIEEHVIKRNHRRGSRFLTVSQEISTYLETIGISGSDITLSYNAVNLVEIVQKASPVDIRELARWPRDTFVVGIIGRLTKQKGHDYLFRAMKTLRDTHPNLRCLVVGEGKLETPLKRLAASFNLTDRVHFAGFRSDIPSILGSLDAFCLPSRGEGLPYAMLEACAFKLPILASRTDAIEELFGHRETAYLVSVGAIHELAHGLKWLIEDSNAATRMGKNAYDFVDKRLNPQRMIDETFSLYDMS